LITNCAGAELAERFAVRRSRTATTASATSLERTYAPLTVTPIPWSGAVIAEKAHTAMLASIAGWMRAGTILCVRARNQKQRASPGPSACAERAMTFARLDNTVMLIAATAVLTGRVTPSKRRSASTLAVGSTVPSLALDHRAAHITLISFAYRMIASGIAATKSALVQFVHQFEKAIVNPSTNAILWTL